MNARDTRWVTLTFTVVKSGELYGYSFEYVYGPPKSGDHRSYSGVFKAQIRDEVHGAACAAGAALKALIKDLQDHRIWLHGLSLKTDNRLFLLLLEQYQERGAITLTDVSQPFCIQMNSLLTSLRCEDIRPQPIDLQKKDWHKVAAWRKLTAFRDKQEMATIAKGK